MVWMQRPPYLRYAAAACLIVVAMWMDLRPSVEVDHPFVARDLVAGAEITADDLEWRPIPPGLFEPVTPGGLAVTDLPAGTPLLSGLMASRPSIPSGWFALEVAVPDLAGPGDAVRLVIDTDNWTDGVVIALAIRDDFLSSDQRALVAIPAEAAAVVADAAGRSAVTVLLGG